MFESLKNTLAGWRTAQAPVTAEDGSEQMREAAGTDASRDEPGFRRLSADNKRNLNPVTQQRMQDMALYLWRTNGLAKQLIELPLAYLLGEGVKMTALDPEVQGWVDDFWNDPINSMALKLPKKVRELSIYGEQCWPVFVNEISGDVRLGYLDPGLIDDVILDPDNAEQQIGVKTVRENGREPRFFRTIINGEENCFSAATQVLRKNFTDGDCFYFSVNDLSNSSRGHSDLLSQIDWLDAFDQSLFGELDRWEFMRLFIWDVELTGATEEDVKERAKGIDRPDSGTVRVHNENEKWSAVSPNLNTGDTEGLSRLFRNHILGASTIPEHWYGGGGDVNRSTGESMSEPTFKSFSMRQQTIRFILITVVTFVARQKFMAITGSEPWKGYFDEIGLDAVFPEMTARDTTKYASALQQLVVAVSMAIDQGMMTRETGIGLISTIAGRLGFEIDPAKELEAAIAARSEQANDDAYPGMDPALASAEPDGGGDE